MSVDGKLKVSHKYYMNIVVKTDLVKHYYIIDVMAEYTLLTTDAILK